MCRCKCCQHRSNCRDSRVTGLSPQSRCDAPRGLHSIGAGIRCSLRPCAGLAGHRPEPAAPLRRPAVNGSPSGLAGHGAEPAIPLRRPGHHTACWDSRVTGLSPQSRCDARVCRFTAGMGLRCLLPPSAGLAGWGLSLHSRCGAPLARGNLPGLAGHVAEPAIPLRRPACAASWYSCDLRGSNVVPRPS